jgi:hypothetical protein
LKQAGVIEEKRKPLTLLQKLQPYLLIGVPLLLLGGVGLGIWHYIYLNQEKNSLRSALDAAESDSGRKALRREGLVALHGAAGVYFIRTQTDGCASKAREQHNKAIAFAAGSHSGGCDAVLGELAIAAGQSERVLPLLAQLYPTKNADRCEAFAVVGLELHRLGYKDEATKALAEVEGPYKVKKGPRPALRPAVVALCLVMERTPPERGKKSDLTEDENYQAGKADGLARQGQLDKARNEANEVPIPGGGRFHALAALAIAAVETKQSDATNDLTAALDRVQEAAGQARLVWDLFQLVQLGVEAGLPTEKLNPAIAAIADPSVAAWARLWQFRKRLSASRSVEPVTALDEVPDKTLARLVASLELARHNTRQSTAWASTIKGWDEGPRTMGALGVALGMQGK